MSDAVFPSFPGLSWDVKITPTFAKMMQATANGLTVRVPRFRDPMWQFECSFEFLRNDPAHNELKRLMGFFCARQGGLDSFLLDLSTLTQDPLDAAVTGQLLGMDANNCAPLVHSMGDSGYQEAVYELKGEPIIRVDGVVLSPRTETVAGDYVLHTPAEVATGVLSKNGITYSGYVVEFTNDSFFLLGAPGAITADFRWYYRVIFGGNGGYGSSPQLGDDQLEFDVLSYALYEAQQITLVTVRE